MKHPLLSSKRFIITGGPTREWIDPVRYISNASSGKMGMALAEAATEVSSDVLFIHGPLSINAESLLCRKIPVETTVEMRDRVLESLVPGCILVMAAAPADYTPASKSDRKIKKTAHTLTIDLVRTPDILKSVRERILKSSDLQSAFVAGFAAETHDVEEYALGKLHSKGLDMICVNDLSQKGAGFNTDTNIITMLFRDGKRKEIPLMNKKDAAKIIISTIGEFVDLQ
jgi:phosphopantothenoylcysteine decarboxylase / phosphopantothenate---cysteine ligase